MRHYYYEWRKDDVETALKHLMPVLKHANISGLEITDALGKMLYAKGYKCFECDNNAHPEDPTDYDRNPMEYQDLTKILFTNEEGVTDEQIAKETSNPPIEKFEGGISVKTMFTYK